jgi:hypothetical protein
MRDPNRPQRDRSVEEVLEELAELGKELEETLRQSENLHLSIEDLRSALIQLRASLRNAVQPPGEPFDAAESKLQEPS